jgi:hypothetical protein
LTGRALVNLDGKTSKPFDKLAWTPEPGFSLLSRPAWHSIPRLY